MKCPECVEAGLKSSLRVDYVITTTAGFNAPWYDEGDDCHDHDGNWHSQWISCSRGHRWERRWLGRCPTESCSWNDTAGDMAPRLIGPTDA